MSFKEARKQTGKSQATVAKDFGVNQSTVALWEMGKTSPRAELLLKIAKYYGYPVEFLLTGNGEESCENENQPITNPNNLQNQYESSLRNFAKQLRPQNNQFPSK